MIVLVDLASLLDEFYSEVLGDTAEPNAGEPNAGEPNTGESEAGRHLQLGTFHPVRKVPSPYSGLLDHNHHMTVTVEDFHADTVNVSVHRHCLQDDSYSREITLVTEGSKKIVQYGIVRLKTSLLAEHVWRRIESGEVPLGRVLIENDVLRQVKLQQLWEIKAGPCLAEKMHSVIGETFFGRTAIIRCDGVPAIELLEIVNRV